MSDKEYRATLRELRKQGFKLKITMLDKGGKKIAHLIHGREHNFIHII
jgi:hypothetical protein